MEKKLIENTILFGDYKEVDNLPLNSIIKDDTSGEVLSGLIIKGYETKFNSSKNENGEVFEKGCLDNFIESYFVKNGLNMPVDIFHKTDIDHLCGRVLIIETNSIGFYFVVYVPKLYKNYSYLKDFLLKEKIVQGFSKLGWATDYEIRYSKDGSFDYLLIKEMEMIKLSLVDTPANGITFEKVQEIKNATKFIKQDKEDKPELDIFK